MKLFYRIVIVCALIFLQSKVQAQEKDSMIVKKDSIYVKSPQDTIRVNEEKRAKDSISRRKRDQHRATIYSAILPGAGQAYNKKYWKVPIVWAAVGIPAYAYFYNKEWYNKCQYALAVTVNGSTGDSLSKVDPALLPLVLRGDETSIINHRNEFRKDQDYAVLFVLLFWGLNIVDATVDAHLKGFNVNDNLSMKVKPTFMPGPYMSAGVSLVFDLHKAKPRNILSTY